MVLIALLYFILASTFTIAKTVLFYAKPFFTIGFRMIIAGFLLLIGSWVINRKKPKIKKEDWLLFFQAIMFHIYIAFMAEFWALQYLSSSKTSLIYAATPFIAAVLSYFLLAEKLSFKKRIGMVIGFIGLIPIILTQTDSREAAMEFFSVSLPEVVLLVGVVSATYAWFIIKKLMDRGYSIPMINGVAMLGGGILSLSTSAIVEGFSPCPVSNWGSFLVWMMLLILVANVVVYNMYSWLLKKYSITLVTFTGFLCPIFGAFLGWFFLDEKITWHYFAALGLIILGLSIFYKDEVNFREKKRVKKSLL